MDRAAYCPTRYQKQRETRFSPLGRGTDPCTVRPLPPPANPLYAVKRICETFTRLPPALSPSTRSDSSAKRYKPNKTKDYK
jgi:hypothetical protein